ncbi:MAG: hypothetical protein ACI30W_05760 [Muribaculaceae bacterium]
MKKLYFLLILILAAGIAASALPAKTAKMKKVVRREAASNAPVALEATDITETGFTANWEPVAGADGYACFVYSKFVAPETEDYVVLDETFDLVNRGSIVEPYYPEYTYVDISGGDFDFTYTPNWSVLEPSFVRGMVGGVVYSPYIDLTNDGGKYTVVLTVQGYASQEIVVDAAGSEDQVLTARLTNTGENVISFDFTNGIHDTYFCIIDNGFPDDTEGDYANGYAAYIDEVAVIQHLEAGDEVLQLVDINDYIDGSETSCRFDDMAYRYAATTLYYDLYAAIPEEGSDGYGDYIFTDFSNLVEVKLLSGVTDAAAVDASAPIEYFTLQGVRVAQPTAGGVYIRRQGTAVDKIAVR